MVAFGNTDIVLFVRPHSYSIVSDRTQLRTWVYLIIERNNGNHICYRHTRESHPLQSNCRT